MRPSTQSMTSCRNGSTDLFTAALLAIMLLGAALVQDAGARAPVNVDSLADAQEFLWSLADSTVTQEVYDIFASSRTMSPDLTRQIEAAIAPVREGNRIARFMENRLIEKAGGGMNVVEAMLTIYLESSLAVVGHEGFRSVAQIMMHQAPFGGASSAAE